MDSATDHKPTSFWPPVPPRSKREQHIYENLPQAGTLDSRLSWHFQTMKMKLYRTFDFLRVWEQTFRKSRRQGDVLEQFLRRGGRISLEPSGQVTAGRDYVSRRRPSFEEQLQVRLSRMTCIAQTLRSLLDRERDRRLKLFCDANASFSRSERILEEMTTIYERHVSEVTSAYQTQIESLQRQQRLFHHSKETLLATIASQQEEINEIKAALDEKTKAVDELTEKVGFLQNENGRLMEEVTSLKAQTYTDLDLRPTKIQLDNEIRTRKHLELLLEIGLGKLRYLEQGNVWSASGHRLTHPSSPARSIGFTGDKDVLDLCGTSEDDQTHLLSDTTVSSIGSLESAVSDIPLVTSDATGGLSRRQVMSAEEPDSEDVICTKKAKRRGRVLLRRILKNSASSDRESPCLGADVLTKSKRRKKPDAYEDVTRLLRLMDVDDDKDKATTDEVTHDAIRIKRASSLESKPNKGGGGGKGNLAKDFGRKLKRKRRARTMEIPRFSIEDIQSMNKAPEGQ